MTEPKPKAVVVVAVMLALFVPQGAAFGQFTSHLEAGGLTTAPTGGVPASTLSLAPGLQYASPRFNLAARGSAWLTGQSWTFADGSVSGSVSSPTLYRLRAEFLSEVNREYYSPVMQSDQINGEARLHLIVSQNGGLWLSTGVDRPWRIASVSSVDVAGAGVWAQIGGATLTGTFTNFSFTKIADSRDSTTNSQLCDTRSAAVAATSAASSDCLQQSHFSDVQGVVRWRIAFLDLSAKTGYRFGDATDVTADSRRWASATAIVWMSPDVATVVGGGRQPANPASGLPARTYAQLGLMFASWPAMTAGNVVIESRASVVSAFDVSAAGTSLQRVQLHAGGVESVEIMGDFTEWEPVTLVRRDRDLWEVLLPIGAGIHHLNVRVDGGKWQVPFGAPTMSDGFNGKVGVLVIE